MTRAAAFTLVEMMVALAVTGILTVMMLQMFSDSSRIWKAEDDRLDTFREARAALQLMSREFATALPLPGATAPGITENFPTLALRDRQTRNVKGLPSEYFTSAFLLAATPNQGRGDLCALGYFLEWEPSIDSKSKNSTASTPAPHTAFALRRQAAQSDTTYARLRQTLPLGLKPPFFGDTTFKNLYSKDAPPSADANSAPAPAPTTETIATYIWDLQFAAAPEPTVTPAPNPSASPAPTLAPGKNGYYGATLPAWVEIRFKALGSTAARKLDGNPAVNEALWSMPNDPAYARLILPAEQQFVSRVKLAR